MNGTAPRLSLDALDECLRELEELRNRADANFDADDGGDAALLHLGIWAGFRASLRRVQAARDVLAAQLQEEPA